MKRYNPKEIEPRWQKRWAVDNLYEAKDFDKRPKYVMLTEFPYPSGDGLHIGHTREYALGDIMARQRRMLGYNVLFPMGYDAFGLPAENYAIKHKIAPQVATEQNIKNFQKQFESLGLSFDWSRSFKTTDPEYYKWTQWLFLQFYKQGLAYRADIAINWCPHCKTGLANEEVINGRHERCDTLVEKKQLKQWLLRITRYADRLIDGLKGLDYPSRIADQQVNWIGRSQGASISFVIEDKTEYTLEVFTTAHDTIYGVTFMVLAPEHPLVSKITTTEQLPEVHSYIKATQGKTEIERQDAGREKTGVSTGAYAINPLNGTRIPIWIADYILVNYGTGAVMAVPGEDARDNEFAKKNHLPIIFTTDTGKFVNYQTEIKNNREKFHLANSEDFNGLNFKDGRQKILDKLIKLGVGREQTQYKLRDWNFSRQHYWGEPIPIIYCPDHGAVPVPDDQLPVKLPHVERYEPTDTGESPLAVISDWVNTTCPICGKPAKRETDTMPNWAGSSWYYLRYYDAHNSEAFADQKKLKYWGAVDMYLGGMEHTTLHLLYSRFWHQFLYDQGLVSTPEPYLARRGQGIILSADGSKMSKSKGNVVNPSEVIDDGYGADALRLSLAFLAPYEQTTPWSPESVAGTHRLLSRVWALTQEFLTTKDREAKKAALNRPTNYAIKKVTQDLERMSFNTAVAALMEFTNELYLAKADKGFGDTKAWQEALDSLLLLLAPFAPHITDELWSQLGHKDSIHQAEWPSYDEKYLVQDKLTIVVQVNGKLRANLTVPSDATKDAILKAAKAHDHVESFTKGKKINREIYVPGKLVNLVTK